MPVQASKRNARKRSLTRLIALILAVVLLGSVLLAAALSSIF